MIPHVHPISSVKVIQLSRSHVSMYSSSLGLMSVMVMVMVMCMGAIAKIDALS